MKAALVVTILGVSILWLAIPSSEPVAIAPRSSAAPAELRAYAPPVPPSLASPRRASLPADAAARADAVDALGATRDDVAVLRELIAHDPHPRVRERAIFAFGDALGTEALPELRAIALADPDEVAMAAAQATVHRIRNAHPAPPRARIDISLPEAFVPGAPIELVIRCTVDEYAPKARFALRLPSAVELLEGDPLEWRGPLAAGQVHEQRYRVRTRDPAAIRARFTADFPDPLDVETVHLRVTLGDGTATATTELART